MKQPEPRVTVIGGGFAGVECAWQLSRRGHRVRLCEMRPRVSTAAHETADFAEMVCSNSFRSDNPLNAVGLLKREMALLGSLVIAAARETRVPAGDALAVDRRAFSAAITREIESTEEIEIVREEVADLPPDGFVVVATGPLTSDSLARSIRERLGTEALYFYDSMAPIVTVDSLDLGRVYAASRYGKGGGEDYLNCPMTRAQYEAFVADLLAGETVPVHDFEKGVYFEGCLPIEVMAERGIETLRHGPLKPMGLEDPRTGERPYAVVQLRQDDLAREHFNMVGFPRISSGSACSIGTRTSTLPRISTGSSDSGRTRGCSSPVRSRASRAISSRRRRGSTSAPRSRSSSRDESRSPRPSRRLWARCRATARSARRRRRSSR
jgi:methylenetetrahydrofolate--tRNA-(uracil-5-)-methyltransferase